MFQDIYDSHFQNKIKLEMLKKLSTTQLVAGEIKSKSQDHN